MNEKQKLVHCRGCHDDYYNYGGNSTSGRCWGLPDMKLVWKKEVHINDIPPWTQKAKLIPQCYHKPKYVYVGKDQTR